MRASRKGVKLGRRTVNKTAMIREIAKRMVQEGRTPRPVAIVDELAGKGIAVSAAQVCVALRGTGMRVKVAATVGCNMDDLKKVEALANEIGRERTLQAVILFTKLSTR
jgi:stage III sporulation protein SpoIIIAA